MEEIDNSKVFTARILAAQGHLRCFIAAALMAHADDVDDVLQNVNLVLVRHAEDYCSDRPFLPWAIGFAKNQIRAYRQHSSRERLVFDDTLLDLAERSAFDSGSAAPARPSLLKRLGECLKRLTKRQRELIELRYYKDLPVQKIAGIQKHSEDSTRVVLFKTRKKLASCITRLCDAGKEEASEEPLEPFDATVGKFLEDPSEDGSKDLLEGLRRDPARLNTWLEQSAVDTLLRELGGTRADEAAPAARPAWRGWLRAAALAAALLAGFFALARLLTKGAPAAAPVSAAIPAPVLSLPVTQVSAAIQTSASSISAPAARTNVPAAAAAVVSTQQKEIPVTMNAIQKTLAATVTVAAAVAATPLAATAARYPGFTSDEAAIDTRIGDTAYTEDQPLDTAAPLGTIYRFF